LCEDLPNLTVSHSGNLDLPEWQCFLLPGLLYMRVGDRFYNVPKQMLTLLRLICSEPVFDLPLLSIFKVI